jgi:simple sugar transport system ATP-binding protein
MKVSDEATIIRHGKVIRHYETLENVTTIDIANDMVGETIVHSKNQTHSYSDEVILKVENVFAGTKLKNLNLQIHAGEILAIAGVEGNGQDDLEYILSGIIQPKKGKIYLKDRESNFQDITNFSSGKKNKSLISVVPGDRHKHGLVLDFDINDNSIIRNL